MRNYSIPVIHSCIYIGEPTPKFSTLSFISDFTLPQTIKIMTCTMARKWLLVVFTFWYASVHVVAQEQSTAAPGVKTFALQSDVTGEVLGEKPRTEDDPRARRGQVQYRDEINIQREGLLYGGYTRRGFGINAGINSEKVRYGIQNGIHDALNWGGITHDKHFKYISEAPSGLYGEMGRFYPFSLY